MQGCEERDGRGRIGLGYRNDPDERFIVCEVCGGSGQRELDFSDMDGERVRVIATGFIGICTVEADGLATVLNDNDVEVCSLTFIELELVE